METPNASRGFEKWLDWLDGQKPWRFLLILYLLRWLIILPTAWLNAWLFPGQADPFFQDLGALDLLTLFLSMLVLNPLLETIVECSLPYWLIRMIPLSSKRPWVFIFISAALMAVMHQTLSALLPSLVTGLFLAYAYGHFALQSQVKATLLTMLFHSCINLVGFTLIILDVS
jgi:hypothetical protein